MNGCYANKLGDCTGKISKEHYISKALLLELGTLEVSGFIWQKGQKMSLGPSSLTASVLCEHHNNTLTDLDNNIVQIFRDFRTAGDTSNHSFKNRKLNIDGLLLQRWILKVMCGMLASGNAMKSPDSTFSKDIPVEWLQCLYGKRAFDTNTGFFIKSEVGLKFNTLDKVGFAPINKKGTSEAIGCHLDFQGYPLYLFMEPYIGTEFLHNPLKLTVTKGKFSDTLQFFYEA